MRKGVSAVIATILLLLITIALAGTAYVYMSGVVTGKISKTISIVDLSCTNGDITIVLSNDGTSNIADGELKVFVDGSPNSLFGSLDPINLHSSSVAVGNTNYGSGTTHTVMVVSPSNSVRQTVYC